MPGDRVVINWMYFHGCFNGKSIFFADYQLMHGPMIPIFESVWGIPCTDLMQTFECDLLIGSQVILQTNITKGKLELVRINCPKMGVFWQDNVFINKCLIIMHCNAHIVSLYGHSNKLAWALRKARKILSQRAINWSGSWRTVHSCRPSVPRI